MSGVWNSDESSSDSGEDDDTGNTMKGNTSTHSSYDYWQQYYQKRKQNNIKQKMNSNQRSYHKYQRNFISSKTGNISNYHQQQHNNNKYGNKSSIKYNNNNIHKSWNGMNNGQYYDSINNKRINKRISNVSSSSSSNTNNNNNDKSIENASNVTPTKNAFNTHIVSPFIDKSTCKNSHSHNKKEEGDTISPFLRVQQHKKKMPYNMSSSSLASMTTPTHLNQQHVFPSHHPPHFNVTTPSESSTTHNFHHLIQQQQAQQQQLQQQMQQIQQRQQYITDNGYISCMKSTQSSALSSLMFTTPQRITYFQQHRHLYFHHEEFTKARELFVKQWRAKEKDKRAMRTEGIILSLCLNIGVDPPDIVRTNPCSVLECWMNPTELPASRALEVIAKRLEDQYCAWKGKRKLNIRKILDGNPELVRTTCGQLRQYATDRRVIFHYNGHGVPRPTEHGELWFFNTNFSEYLPVSILDIAQWLQTPSMIILDCSASGKIVSSFKQYEPILKQQQMHIRNKAKNINITDTKKKHRATIDVDEYDTDELYRFGTMILAACDENEILPMNPEYPADIFTSCLTSPIKMALKWFISTQLLHDKCNVDMVLDELNKKDGNDGDKNDAMDENKDDSDKDYEHKFSKTSSDDHIKKNKPANYNNYMALLDMIFDESIGGKKDDKKRILGELHWIFLSVTDTIAWNVLPNKLFQNLFRLDYTIQSIFRNYLLAERIMKSMNRNPVSYPSLPSTNNHPMWQAWDSAVDAALLQLKQWVNKKNQWKYQQLLKLKIQQQQTQQAQPPKKRKSRIFINDVPIISNIDNNNKKKNEDRNDNDNDDDDEDGKDDEKKSEIKATPKVIPQRVNKFTASNSNLIDLEPELKWVPSQFFMDELRAFEVWIDSGSIQKKPYHLPIVLQALLNKQYRLRALTLLSRYLDLGPWTVNYVLWVGLHSYFKLLLKQAINDGIGSTKTLRYSLTFIWAKILAHDPSCRHDLIAGKHYVFFYRELKREDNSDQQIFLSTFILAQIASYQPTGQKVLLGKVCGGTKKSNKNSLLQILRENIFHPNNNIKIWSILCIAKIWQNLDEIKSIAYDITDVLILQLSSICIEVRAATMYALGTFFNIDNNHNIISNQNNKIILGQNFDLTLAHQLTKLVHDPSPIIRMELVFVLSSLIYYQQDEFREYYNKQKQIKKEQKRRQKEEEQQRQKEEMMKITKSKSNYNISGKKNSFWGKATSKSSSSSKGTSKSLKKHQHSESYHDFKSIAKSTSPKFRHLNNNNLPSLQSTQSVPPQNKYNNQQRPQLQQYGHGAHSAMPINATSNTSNTLTRSNNMNHSRFCIENRISPMIAPLNITENIAADNKEKEEESVSFPDIREQEYEQRKRIWEVIKVLCKDPIAEISRNANKVKVYMTSDKVKSSRSRALSDPEKHAKMLLEKTTLKNTNSEQIRRSKTDENKSKRPASTRATHHHQYKMFGEKIESKGHNKSNTIFGALSGGLGKNKKKEKEQQEQQQQQQQQQQLKHRKQQSQQYQYQNGSPSKKNMRGKSAFFVNGSCESKESDPNWNIPDSPLFSWLTEYISRPLTNAMYDAPDPLYHELDPKNLPLIDPRLTMSNFFYHQEQQKYDQQQKLFNKRCDENFRMESNQQNILNGDNTINGDFNLYGYGSRGSISSYFGHSSSFKLRYNEMNATLALNYIRLAAIRSWETRKFYMFAERAKSTWKQLLKIVDPDTSSQKNKINIHQHSKSVASSPNPPNYEDQLRISSMSFTLPSGMIAPDDNTTKSRVRSLSNDFQQRQIANSQNPPKSPTKKKKILSFLGGGGNKNKNDNDGKLGSSYDSNKYLSPNKGGHHNNNANSTESLSHSLDAPISPNTNTNNNDEETMMRMPANSIMSQSSSTHSPRQQTATTTTTTYSPPSPYISPYILDDIESPSMDGSGYLNYKQYSTDSITKDSAYKFLKTGMRINNQIERYDTECDRGITAIKFHPFRNILYCADGYGRVWVWKYESNIGANNPENKRRINLVNIRDTHLSNATLITGTNNNNTNTTLNSRISNSSHSAKSAKSANSQSLGNNMMMMTHSQSVGNFHDMNKMNNISNLPSSSSNISDTNTIDTHINNISDRVVVTSFEIINEYHDTMLLCAGDDGTIRIYRNSHLENSMSAVTAFLANARIKPTRSIHGQHGDGQMITNWCPEFGYLYSGGSHNSIKIHDCNNESYVGYYNTKCNTTSILCGNKNMMDKNLLIAGCTDNKLRIFDLRTNLNTNNNVSEIAINFSSSSTAKIINVKPTHREYSNYYYVCSTEELLLFDLRSLRNGSIITRIPFKKYINTFDSHKYAPIYALGSTKQFVQICSSLKLDSKLDSTKPSISKNKQQIQSVNEIAYHDGFLGARIGPVRLLKFHPFKLVLAVGGTNKYLSLYASSNNKNNLL